VTVPEQLCVPAHPHVHVTGSAVAPVKYDFAEPKPDGQVVCVVTATGCQVSGTGRHDAGEVHTSTAASLTVMPPSLGQVSPLQVNIADASCVVVVTSMPATPTVLPALPALPALPSG